MYNLNEVMIETQEQEQDNASLERRRSPCIERLYRPVLTPWINYKLSQIRLFLELIS